jgi:WD40 repeat protein
MRIVSGSNDETVRVWDASTGAELNSVEGHTGRSTRLRFSRDGMRDCVWLDVTVLCGCGMRQQVQS